MMTIPTMTTLNLCVALFIYSSFFIFGATSFTVVPLQQGSTGNCHLLLTRDNNYKSKPYSYRINDDPHCAAAARSSATRLNLLLDVPDQFFTYTFPVLGILLSLSKNYARAALEDAAWEQRLAEGRAARLAQDPTLTELDLRRQEAAHEWSAYGKPRWQEEEAAAARTAAAGQPGDAVGERGGRRQGRVRVLDREDEYEDSEDTKSSKEYDPRDYRLTEDEIVAFEREYGIEYDAYYDEPYTTDELPEGDFDVDRLYGDRIYKKSGEIFYRDADTGLFWRQGSKPRNLTFFGLK